MSALPYLDLVGEVAKYGMYLTLITNSSLIYITEKHIKNIKGPYKFLVLMLAVLGMIFSIMETFVRPFFHSFNASFVYFSIAPMLGASKSVKTALVLLYSEIYLLIICVIAIQFFYRYLIIANSPRLRLFTGWNALLWIAYLTICMTVWAYAGYLCLPDSFTDDYLKEEMLTQYNKSSDEIPGFFVVAYEHIGHIRHLKINAVLNTCGATFTLFIQYIIIIFCGFKIHLKIRDTMEATSCKKYRLQSQLFKTLVLQITAPSLFYHTPAFLMYLIPYFDLEISIPSGVMVCFFSVYPAIDTIVLMWMVTEYHRVVARMIEKFLADALKWIEKFTGKGGEESTTQTA